MSAYVSTRHASRPTIHQPDITLLLDDSGIIRKANLANDLPSEGFESWLGRPWIETVGEGGTDKVRGMLDDALSVGVSAFRLVQQRFPNGTELPVEYSTVRLGGQSGLIAIGKNQQAVAELQSRLIATQQAREQDYWKLREVETRYRLLFDASHEAVLLIRADTLRVVELNLAAQRALNVAPGQELLPELNPAEAETLIAMLVRVREQGRAPGVILHLGAEGSAWIIRASMMSSEPGPLFMLQLAPAGGVVVTGDHPSPPADALLDRLPDAFLVLDGDGVILRANPAFLDLIQAGGEGAVIGEKLGRWLQRPGADMGVLLATLQRHRTVRMMSTFVQNENGEDIAVEISAAGNDPAASRLIGVLLRDVSRREVSASVAPQEVTPGASLRAVLDSMDTQIGQTPLPRLVRETVEVLERHFIEAALERAAGNRTATAELLGLSRQSLYVKLNRYGLDTESQSGVDTTP
jgi:transcriptional regulator PpsR